MSPRILALSERLYACLLRAYPMTFRERFAAEMAQVFRSLCREAYAQSGAAGVASLWLPAAWDGVWGVIYQWWLCLFKQRMGNMETSSSEPRQGVRPLSALQAGIAALPFLAFGASSLASRLDFFYTDLASRPVWQALLIYPFLAFNWLILIGLVVCLLTGFRRWGYPFLGWGLLFAWWWSAMSFFGYASGWKIWLPLLGALLLPLVIRRSWQPIRALLAGLMEDWTLLSLGVYILYGYVFMLSDENHHPYLFAFIAATTLIVSAGAWGYFRLASPLRRVLTLMGGLFLAAGLSVLNYATWDYRAYYGLPESANHVNLGGLIAAAVLAIFMLGNGLLARWWLKRSSRMKAT